MIMKIIGGACILTGIFFIIFFPETKQFEFIQFTKTAIIIGIFLILLGIYLIRM